MVPVAVERFDRLLPPADMRHVNYFDLIGWSGEDSFEEWKRTLQALDKLVGRKPQSTRNQRRKGFRARDSEVKAEAHHNLVDSITEGGRAVDLFEETSSRLGIRMGQLFIENPLELSRIRGEYEDVWTERPPAIEAVARTEVERTMLTALKAGFSIDDNLSYELRRVSVSRAADRLGNRSNNYKLTFRPTDFRSFVYPNLHVHTLEKSDPAASEALRIEADLIKQNLLFDELDVLRARFRVGTNTIAVTSDNKVVLSVRSKRQLMATGARIAGSPQPVFRLHTSAAEGMFRSDPQGSTDDDQLFGGPHPGATSVRALRKELGLLPSRHYALDRLKCLGWYMDLLRSEPQFVFFARLNATTDEICDVWDRGTEDAHENVSICCVPWNVECITSVYKQRPMSDLNAIIPGKDKAIFDNAINARCEWSSNHAKASMLICCAHEFGSEATARDIASVMALIDQRPTN